MKVSLIHGERRTLQQIQLAGEGVVATLRGAQSLDVELEPGKPVEFLATVTSPEFGEVPFVIRHACVDVFPLIEFSSAAEHSSSPEFGWTQYAFPLRHGDPLQVRLLLPVQESVEVQGQRVVATA
jgi:hypothetical protein